MAIKVDLYSVREGRESGGGTSAGKGGRVVGSLLDKRENWGGPSTRLGRHHCRGAKAARVEEEELGRGQEFKKMQKANK